MEHIVVATGGSAGGNRAVALAARIARAFDARLDVITVVPGYEEVLLDFTHPNGKQTDEAVARIGRVHLEAALRAADLSGVELRTAILLGPPGVEISVYAETHAPDLVVLGGRGRVAATVLESAACPVLTLR